MKVTEFQNGKHFNDMSVKQEQNDVVTVTMSSRKEKKTYILTVQNYGKADEVILASEER